MANYKEMYVQLFKETTKAIELLQKAQQQCEELYLNSEETEIFSLCNERAEKSEKSDTKPQMRM